MIRVTDCQYCGREVVVNLHGYQRPHGCKSGNWAIAETPLRYLYSSIPLPRVIDQQEYERVMVCVNAILEQETK